MSHFISKIVSNRLTHHVLFWILVASLLITGLKVTESVHYIYFQELVQTIDLTLLVLLILFCLAFSIYKISLKPRPFRKEWLLLVTFFFLLIDFSISLLSDIIIDLKMELRPFHFFSLTRIFVFFLLYYEFFQETSLRHIVRGIKRAYKPLTSVITLLLLVLYAFALLSYELFSKTNPEIFGTLSDSFIILFHMMLGDTFGEPIRAVSEHNPYAPVFFLVFMISSGFIVINLFVTVLVNGFSEVLDEARKKHSEEQHIELLASLENLKKDLEKRVSLTKKKLPPKMASKKT